MAATVVITAGVPWEGATARPQHFARGLARRGWNVLFVNAPISWLSPLKNPALRGRLLPAQPVRVVHESDVQGRLRVLAPVAGLPGANQQRWLNRLNQRLLALQVRSASPEPYVLLPMLPGSVDLIPHLAPRLTVYDCVDFHTEFGGLLNPDVVSRMEQELVAQSRVVFATADKLRERMRAWHSDVRLLPNAAEIDHFRTARDADVHPRLADIPEPRVIFVGGIGAWVDMECIATLAKERKDVQFVMVGPVETVIGEARKLPNIHWLGLQPYAELPQFLAGCAAAVIPFCKTDLAQAVNPIKVYEYLAAGKEVIATPIHELRKLDRFIWLADTADEWRSSFRSS